jgi:hypothetical protein
MEFSRRLAGLRNPRSHAGPTVASLGQRTIFNDTRFIDPCQAPGMETRHGNLRLFVGQGIEARLKARESL